MHKEKANAKQFPEEIPLPVVSFDPEPINDFFKHLYSLDESVSLLSKIQFQYMDMYLKDISNSDFHEEAHESFLFLADMKRAFTKALGLENHVLSS